LSEAAIGDGSVVLVGSVVVWISPSGQLILGNQAKTVISVDLVRKMPITSKTLIAVFFYYVAFNNMPTLMKHRSADSRDNLIGLKNCIRKLSGTATSLATNSFHKSFDVVIFLIEHQSLCITC
jgi:hypothetical protein